MMSWKREAKEMKVFRHSSTSSKSASVRCGWHDAMCSVVVVVVVAKPQQ